MSTYKLCYVHATLLLSDFFLTLRLNAILMKNTNRKDIPFHYFSNTFESINIVDGCPVISVKPEFPVVIARLEMFDSKAAQTIIPHRHDYYEILFIEDGEGEHIIDFDSYTIKPPVVYCLTKGQIHFWKLKRQLKGVAILFPREFLLTPETQPTDDNDLSILNTLSEASFLPIDKEDISIIQETLNNIAVEFQREEGSSISILRAYIHILTVTLFRVYAKNQSQDILILSNTMVRKFRQLTLDNFTSIHSVKKYAEMLGVSTTHLRNTVKEVTGYSPRQIIQQEIVFESKRLLANTELTIAQIGYKLNFEDPSYFSRFFKREIGINPLKYRDLVREKYSLKI